MAETIQQGSAIPSPSESTFAVLQAGEVIPDVIPAQPPFIPTVFFSIIFPGFSSNPLEIMLGATYELDRTSKEPELEVVATAPEQLEGAFEGSPKSYTVVMTDPDAPTKTNPKFGQWRHWVATGVRLPVAGSGKTFASKTKPASTKYMGPGPPPGSGPHRYVVLLFEEPPSFEIPAQAVEKKSDEESRAKWDAMKFANEYNLKLVGANFFITERQ